MSPDRRPAQTESGVGEALDRSEDARLRVFLAFGAVMPFVVIPLSSWLGGDPGSRHFFQAGMVWLAVSSLGRLWVSYRRPSWMSRVPRDVEWVILSTLGFLWLIPTLEYLGPFSAALIAFPAALMFTALRRNRVAAYVTLAFAVGMQVFVALPIIIGSTKDLGLLSSGSLQRPQLIVAEALVVLMIAVNYRLARQVRETSAAELADARRIIGDQRQLLGEVQERVDKIKRNKIGRWTGKTIGRWQLGEVIGRGAMGEVYEARDAGGGPAAIKVLTALAEESRLIVERFEREMQIAARLDSPHIVRVLDTSSQVDTVQFLAMELLRGTDLAEHLRAEMRMSIPQVVTMLDQVARGLEVAHQAGVVHRDLKPHNLFLHDTSCWKILDFGVAKVFGVEGTLTQQAMVGTPQYMAPEQAAGEPVTHRSDIYALGAIAYRCLTGRVPHEAKEFAALIYQVVRASPVRPGKLAQVPREVEDVLAVAMAKEPRRRFASAAEFVEQLSAAAAGRPTNTEPPADAWA